MVNINELSLYVVYNSWLHTWNTAFCINVCDQISAGFGLNHTALKNRLSFLHFIVSFYVKEFLQNNACRDILHCKHYFHGEADIRFWHFHLPFPSYQMYAATTPHKPKTWVLLIVYAGWHKSNRDLQESVKAIHKQAVPWQNIKWDT